MAFFVTQSYLVDGDALVPDSLDLIAQTGYLDVGDPVPAGWRVLTGNANRSLVARIIYRYELDE